MAAEPQEPDRTLGYTEGRITELSMSIHELNRRMDSGLAEVNRRLDSGLSEVNRRIDRLFLATLGIGGGIIATLVGLLITQIIQGR
jgi:tetrahydromethanopterin S-methyltransferase subunit G